MVFRVPKPGEFRTEALEMVRMIRLSGDALLRVVNDVLDFSKVEVGEMELGMLSRMSCWRLRFVGRFELALRVRHDPSRKIRQEVDFRRR